MPAIIDTELLKYATPIQARYLEAVNEHGSERAAAAALGLNKSTVNDAIRRLKGAAALQGYSPEHDLVHPTAPGQRLKGTSTLYKDGVPVVQWVKTTADQEAQRVIEQAAFEALAEELPRLEPIPGPKHSLEHLLNLYTLTDSHVGMLAWDKENLDKDGNWDLTIAERTLVGCFEHMVRSSPAARVGVVAQLGDFLHSDGLAAVTPTSGHLLEQDGRFPKVVKAAIRILRHVVNFALEHHDRVIVLMAEGNHDLASSVWLRAMFQALYENEPRVTVIDSELPFYVHQHGTTMLAWHHGHLKKKEALPLMFATQFPKIWGNTVYRYAHTGHQHHEDIKEHSGMKVIQHSSLATRDAHASRHGWHSIRQCVAMTYHSSRGLVGSNVVTPEMLEPETA